MSTTPIDYVKEIAEIKTLLTEVTNTIKEQDRLLTILQIATPFLLFIASRIVDHLLSNARNKREDRIHKRNIDIEEYNRIMKKVRDFVIRANALYTLFKNQEFILDKEITDLRDGELKHITVSLGQLGLDHLIDVIELYWSVIEHTVKFDEDILLENASEFFTDYYTTFKWIQTEIFKPESIVRKETIILQDGQSSSYITANTVLVDMISNNLERYFFKKSKEYYNHYYK